MRNKRRDMRKNHAKGGRVKIKLPAFNAKEPTAVRIVDQALAVQGWTRTARLKILKALKDGDGDAVFIHSDENEACLTEINSSPTSEITHAERCESRGFNPASNWSPGMPGATEPIDKLTA